MFRCILLTLREGRGFPPGRFPKQASRPPSGRGNWEPFYSASAVQTTGDSGVQMAM